MKALIILFAMLTFKDCYSQRGQSLSGNERRNAGIILTVGGLSFTTAAILEGGANYTTVQVVQINPTTQTHKYHTKPFFQQYPRSIMFTVGASLTITGLFSLGNR